MTDKLPYAPSDIQSAETCMYVGTLEEGEWESVASFILRKSQKEGKWTPIKDFHRSYDVEGMVQRGFLEEGDNGYMLTKRALERIVREHPAEG